MVISVRLEAIRKGSEELRGGVTERPDIKLVENQLTTLGKNAVTMVADMGLKRNILQVRLEPGCNELRIVSVVSGRVSVNGELVDAHTVLEAGDVLSLHAPQRAYEYKVVFEGGIAGPAPADASAAPPRVAAPGSCCLELIAEEFICAVCLDLQVQATTLVPCGHSFCKACVAATCPICSSAIHTTVSCRAIDNAIALLVSRGHAVAPDDAQVYQQRLREATKSTSRSSKNATPKKRKLNARVSAGRSVGASFTAAISID